MFRTERTPPPGWEVANEGSILTGAIGCYPPGSKVGSERTPRISAAGERDAIEGAWEWIRGEVPLHQMAVSRYDDYEHCVNLVCFHLGLPMDPHRRESLANWYAWRALTKEEQDRLREQLRERLEKIT